MSRFVYVDTETTGLDPQRHEVWELAYAIGEGPIKSAILFHSLRHADPKALDMNGYWERVEKASRHTWSAVEVGCREALTGSTLVAANPAFDAAFLKARWGEAPWRYRMLDIEAYAMGAFGWDHPKGLKDIVAELALKGYEIPAPDHSARADVQALRDCHWALQEIYGGAS